MNCRYSLEWNSAIRSFGLLTSITFQCSCGVSGKLYGMGSIWNKLHQVNDCDSKAICVRCSQHTVSIGGHWQPARKSHSVLHARTGLSSKDAKRHQVDNCRSKVDYIGSRLNLAVCSCLSLGR